MSSIETLVSIVGVISVLWSLVLGQKTVIDIITYFRQKKPFHFSISSSVVSNIFSFVIIMLLVGIYFNRGNICPPPIPVTPTPSPSAGTSTVPSSPSLGQDGKVLYQADFEKNGLYGWNGSPSWNFSQGMAINDGKGVGDSVIVPPYHSTVTSYAVEATIKKIRCGFLERFGIRARGIDVVLDPDAKSVYVWLAGNNINEKIAGDAYETDDALHTYRLEVKEQNITFFVDNQKIISASDNTILSGGQIGLLSYHCQVNVKSFRVLGV